MNNQKYEYSYLPDFLPEKVFRCPCLLYVVNKLLVAGIKDYRSICRELSNKYGGNGTVFCTRVNDKKSCILLCHHHVNQLIWGVLRCDYTANEDTDFIFPFFQKRLCKSCLPHYLRTHCTMYLSVIFNE